MSYGELISDPLEAILKEFEKFKEFHTWLKRVRNSLESTDKTDGATVEDNNKLFSTVEHEPMATDHKPIHSNGSEIESVTAIEYNPHETIDKSQPVVEQQPSTSSATIKKI
ncbi:hypothetical protein AVEN_124852-1 [Araneus ventricosus]|uniref:Uncharacterized protein n=1 Tax=Araneus ventricosus TaxID=182803 RepID=A0A4Y2UCQ6_ARAVE|nr:hypothetical protein AVEN_124852-1 [Araneus ventricosus]